MLRLWFISINHAAISLKKICLLKLKVLLDFMFSWNQTLIWLQKSSQKISLIAQTFVLVPNRPSPSVSSFSFLCLSPVSSFSAECCRHCLRLGEQLRGFSKSEPKSSQWLRTAMHPPRRKMVLSQQLFSS